jgi:hypothetical protein
MTELKDELTAGEASLRPKTERNRRAKSGSSLCRRYMSAPANRKQVILENLSLRSREELLRELILEASRLRAEHPEKSLALAEHLVTILPASGIAEEGPKILKEATLVRALSVAHLGYHTQGGTSLIGDGGRIYIYDANGGEVEIEESDFVAMLEVLMGNKGLHGGENE